MQKKKRKYLGSGFIWFGGNSAPGYDQVTLYTEKNGGGRRVRIRIGKLGGWQKVKLYAEYTE